MIDNISMVLGHAIPGTYMAITSVWWIANIVKTISNAQKTTSNRTVVARIGTYFLGPFCQFPVESAIKILLGLSGILNEIYLHFAYIRAHARPNDAQHLAIYVMFGLVGVVELLRHFRCRGTPDGAERVAFMILVGIMAASFAFHHQPNSPLRDTMHLLLVYINLAVLLCCFFEMLQSSHDAMGGIFMLGRAYLMLLQGTWFLQIGAYFCDTSQWDEQNHEHQMWLSVLFVWHFVVDFGLAMVVAACVRVFWWHGNERVELVDKVVGGLHYAPVYLDECEKAMNVARSV